MLRCLGRFVRVIKMVKEQNRQNCESNTWNIYIYTYISGKPIPLLGFCIILEAWQAEHKNAWLKEKFERVCVCVFFGINIFMISWGEAQASLNVENAFEIVINSY